jgi:FixJ family two-component response regulator
MPARNPDDGGSASRSQPDQPAAHRLADRSALPEEPLDAREIDILRLLERGLSNKQIARNLGSASAANRSPKRDGGTSFKFAQYSVDRMFGIDCCD